MHQKSHLHVHAVLRLVIDHRRRRIDHVVGHLGPVPSDPAARDRWVEAAGRIAQHRALWPVANDVPLGSPPLDGPPERSLTYYAATNAVADFDRAIGIERRTITRDAPGLSL